MLKRSSPDQRCVTLERAIEMASRGGWLSSQPESFVRRFLKDATTRFYDAGKTLFEHGDPVLDMLCLVEGMLEIYIEHPQIGFALFHFGQPGIWFGEQRVYGLDRRRITVRAKLPSTVLSIPARSLDRMIEDDPMTLKSFGLLSDMNLAWCMKVVGETLQSNSLVRVSVRLVTLAVARSAGGRKERVDLAINQDELATLCNLSRKTLNRALGMLREAGVVRTNYGTVTIVNLEKLSEIASNAAHASAGGWKLT